MNADDYQREAARTLITEPDHGFSGNELMLMWCALGLGGEAGEVLDHLKKGICHQHGIDRDTLIEELGDLLWYVASICELAGIPLGLVLARNIEKLEKRYPNGYSSADSKARVDQPVTALPELPNPEVGDLDLCKMCGNQIVYRGPYHDGPYWNHQGELMPKHPAMPTRYAV